MWWFLGGSREPVTGPFCFHAGLIVEPTAAAQVFATGAATSDPDAEGAAGMTIVGQVYAPGLVATAASAPGLGEAAVFTPGGVAGQGACEDD